MTKRLLLVFLCFAILCPAAYAEETDIDIDGAKAVMMEALLSLDESIDLFEYGLSEETLGDLFTDLVQSSPELFYVSSSYSYYINDYTQKILAFMPEYRYTEDEIEEKRQLIDDECAKILLEIQPQMSEADKALVVHDYFALHYEYNTPASIEGVTEYPQAYTMEGLFLEKMAVCQGFTLGYMYVLKKLGIESVFLPSYDMGHAWNLVKIDGKWYHVDVTADTVENDLVSWVYHKCFLLSDDAIAQRQHYGWANIYKATDKKYDNWYWKNVASVILYKDGYWYYSDTDYSGKVPECVVCRRKASNGETSIIIRNIGAWRFSEDGRNFYQILGMVKIFLLGDKIYYSAPDAIYSANLNGSGIKKVYTPVVEGTYAYVYGLAKKGRKARYCVASYPYEQADYVSEFDLTDAELINVLPSDDGTVTVALLDDEIEGGKLFAAAYSTDKSQCLKIFTEEITQKRVYFFSFPDNSYSSVKIMLWDSFAPVLPPVEVSR